MMHGPINIRELLVFYFFNLESQDYLPREILTLQGIRQNQIGKHNIKANFLFGKTSALLN